MMNNVYKSKFFSLEPILIENDKFLLTRYQNLDKELYMKAWNETFENSALLMDENLKEKSWKDVLDSKNRLQLKIIDKATQNYVGEIMLMELDSETPEIGIQLLKKYQGHGIGTHVVRLFIDRVKLITDVDYFLVRISSDNYISQKLFEKIGATRIGEEGKEMADLFRNIMEKEGLQKIEEIIKGDFEKTQKYTICYKLGI